MIQVAATAISAANEPGIAGDAGVLGLLEQHVGRNAGANEMPPALIDRPIARISIITQTAGPAQSWNLRTVSMPCWMISNCSAQTMT